MRRPKKTVTIDLSSYLSAGTYNVKVKSKGTDIRDSEDSNVIECVVSGSLSDLTGTRWYFNEEILSQISTEINFISNNETYNTFIAVVEGQPPRITVMINYGSNTVYYDGWTNQAYRTIEITGGADATNATLIAWLEANAVQIFSGGGSDN